MLSLRSVKQVQATPEDSVQVTSVADDGVQDLLDGRSSQRTAMLTCTSKIDRSIYLKAR